MATWSTMLWHAISDKSMSIMSWHVNGKARVPSPHVAPFAQQGLDRLVLRQGHFGHIAPSTIFARTRHLSAAPSPMTCRSRSSSSTRPTSRLGNYELRWETNMNSLVPISVGKLIQPWCRTLPSRTASPRRSCRIPTRCRQALFETSGKCHCRSWTKRLSEAQLPTRNHRWAAAGLWSCQRLKSTDPNSPSRWEWCGPSSLEHRPTSSRQSRSGESAIRPLPFPYQVMSMVGSLW